VQHYLLRVRYSASVYVAVGLCGLGEERREERRTGLGRRGRTTSDRGIAASEAEKVPTRGDIGGLRRQAGRQAGRESSQKDSEGSELILSQQKLNLRSIEKWKSDFTVLTLPPLL
jgi:hypothetical protein